MKRGGRVKCKRWTQSTHRSFSGDVGGETTRPSSRRKNPVSPTSVGWTSDQGLVSTLRSGSPGSVFRGRTRERFTPRKDRSSSDKCPCPDVGSMTERRLVSVTDPRRSPSDRRRRQKTRKTLLCPVMYTSWILGIRCV